MANVLFDEGVQGAPSTDVDTLYIAAMDPAITNPFPPTYTTVVDEQYVLLQTDGSVSCTFSLAVVPGNPYWIRVRHRNHTETWSNGTVVLTGAVTYSFSSNISQAYGDAQVESPDMAGYMFYVGDITYEGAIDGFDYALLDAEIQLGNGGYNYGDFTGEGAVDGFDYAAMDPNLRAGAGSVIP